MIRYAVAAVALAVVSLTVPAGSPVTAQARLMPLSEVKPGMVGVGRTVFEGAELSDFTVHIIGVLRNIQGPKRNLIIARLEGGPLARTGVAAGMSGSPVYVDGRLIGAVGYSIGSFPTEAIAGITPIEEMKDAAAMPARRPAASRRASNCPSRTSHSPPALRRSLTRTSSSFAVRGADVDARGVPAADAHPARVDAPPDRDAAADGRLRA